jgi:hypothetical protein
MKKLIITFNSLLAATLIIFFSSANTMAQEKNRIDSWIEKDAHAPNLCFRAYFKNQSETAIKHLSYRFRGWKNSESGTSNITQSGQFKARPGKKVTLSTIELNRVEDGTVSLKLEIFQRDTLIAVDSLEIKP